MTAQLNHTIIWSSNPIESARFLSELLGLSPPVPFARFQVVKLGNGVSFDFAKADGTIQSQHYAFLISEDEFDATLGRIQARGFDYWADPFGHELRRINHGDGGRGAYLLDPDGHNLEIITRPYGSSGD